MENKKIGKCHKGWQMPGCCPCACSLCVNVCVCVCVCACASMCSVTLYFRVSLCLSQWQASRSRVQTCGGHLARSRRREHRHHGDAVTSSDGEQLNQRGPHSNKPKPVFHTSKAHGEHEATITVEVLKSDSFLRVFKWHSFPTNTHTRTHFLDIVITSWCPPLWNSRGPGSRSPWPTWGEFTQNAISTKCITVSSVCVLSGWPWIDGQTVGKPKSQSASSHTDESEWVTPRETRPRKGCLFKKQSKWTLIFELGTRSRNVLL